MNDYSFNNLLEKVNRSGHHSDKVSAIQASLDSAQRIWSYQAAQLIEDPVDYAKTVGNAINHHSTEEELKQFCREN
ncbi:unnamed protein product [Adineta steineri]|uniref:Uncharacterized protein n=1 Tax=Adineta steineri TaxID=433720 RepID=A0A820BS80_9BILA|nr:unnamed protein product [Adineta steineri]CAF4196233.1 unnamed protein product [Adineta steineri]